MIDVNIQEMIQALCDLEEGLSDWEVNFVEDMSKKPSGYYFTAKQTAAIKKLYEEHC